MTKISQISSGVSAGPALSVQRSTSVADAPAKGSRWLMLALLAIAPVGLVSAFGPQVKPLAPPPAPAPRAVIVQPSANAQFQQKMQQAQVRSQLQQAQVEQQNHQALSQNVMRPNANNPQLQQQMDQANAAQQRTDRARQQSIIDRYNAAPPPAGQVVVPASSPPAKPAGGG
jgi:hypothetical protein